MPASRRIIDHGRSADVVDAEFFQLAEDACVAPTGLTGQPENEIANVLIGFRSAALGSYRVRLRRADFLLEPALKRAWRHDRDELAYRGADEFAVLQEPIAFIWCDVDPCG